MYPTDPNSADSAAIIPFAPRSFQNEDGPSDEVSTIVAVVAVTLRHDSTMSPEEGLADLIEASGQAEIIEIQDDVIEKHLLDYCAKIGFKSEYRSLHVYGICKQCL